MLRAWFLAVRSVAHRPGFAAAAILILGAGIAASTTVFSIVDATVLEPLPYPHADRLVLVLEANSAKSDTVGLVAPGRLEGVYTVPEHNHGTSKRSSFITGIRKPVP